MTYIGRFAPSPSGPLHFGSLIAAVGSYLRARSQQGKWLVRIEDLDPPREQPGAAKGILQTLERFGLYWDGPIIYQSQRHERYQAILDELYRQGKTYHCRCTRAQIQAAGGFYQGTCRDKQYPAKDAAVRLRLTTPCYAFHDQLLGLVDVEHRLAAEDFILKRRDGLFAYNLAVVVDDADSGITEVVRGADLLEPTVRQIALYQQLGWTEPDWLHLPLALQENGLKLSKQNHAPAIDGLPVVETLCQVLTFLGQPLPEYCFDLTAEALLDWAITHWQLSRVPTTASVHRA
ncbi:tRNA glutamyl-Q(34) synthetase GluQRS [Tolumonas lignilytica]|uniref:tRNA glutamyl-Q(34) synthetase GluQRS n=1 Tax=Tolumonas lignilytica TaxID=1283284 RepID=UPI00046632AD|nr:tRNA glutamyl-Q(34) synthetase GluQRS [Tolumonas lignilytica]